MPGRGLLWVLMIPVLSIPFCQAGLAGYSDRAMRLVARHYGCGYALTEALLEDYVVQGGSAVKRKLAVADGDHPLAGQLMGSDPAKLAQAARVLVELGHDVIDLNFGCPVRKLSKPRGGHLLGYLEQAIAILKAVRDAVPAHIPTTVKMRRGTEDGPAAEENFHKIFAAVWDAGYSAACVHGRTVRQGYVGRSRWDFLANLKKQYPGRTILGSGDVFTAQDAVNMLAETGVDGVWIARGAIGNPWIFAAAEELRNARAAGRQSVVMPPSVAQQREAMMLHLRLATEDYGESKSFLKVRSVGMRYARFHPSAPEVRQAFIDARTRETMDALFNRYYHDDQPGIWPLTNAEDSCRTRSRRF